MRESEINLLNMMNTSASFDDKRMAEFVSAIDSVINSFCINSEQLCDAIMTNDNARITMSKIIPCWMQMLEFEKKNNMYDGRNEYSVKIGCHVPYKDVLSTEIQEYGFVDEKDLKYCVNCFGLKRLSDVRPLNVGQYVAVYMIRNHRTLQQTFSNLVFYILHKYYGVKMKDDYWYSCPCV